ncbi:histidine phosphatase family protein [Faecalibacterium sp. An77]|uniref:histidine phosphatase family protein n=1 Tax=unclassified Faecalibacterium TaxID=2646395 RepID=UPI000B373B4A|nr:MULTISPECIES: histidine phosphatase family protein [unclassified Faecalibacterium]OUN39318.1 histidine phosphatase family protein [Faecalibacterium sp. An77]OUP28690.1 histidine phosphatase family protein [Faecalibacterium sp. An192]
MKTVYFTRHGQTVWNVENKICGVTDSPLTDLGRQQARALGRQLAADSHGITRILCSPLSRARETAEIVAASTGLPLTVEPRLREQAFGRYEGTPRNDAAFALAKLHFADRFEGGESMFQLAARIYSLLDDLSQQDGTALLVAHNGIARMVHSYFNEMTNEEFALFGIGNCALIGYDFPESKPY